MASLNTLRTKFGIVLSIIIALALLAFILSLKTEMGFTGNDPRVGEIDGTKINYSEYYNEYEQVKARSGVQESDEQQAAMLSTAAWQSLVAQHMLLPGFDRLGLRVTEPERQALLSGQHASQTFYNAFADPRTGVYDIRAVSEFLTHAETDPQAARAWADLNEQARLERSLQKYQGLVRGGVWVNALEIARGADAANKTFSGRWAGKKYATVPDSLVSVSKAEIRSYYNDRKNAYRQTPSRTLSYVVFEVEPTDDDLAALEERVRGIGERFVATDSLRQFVRADRNGHIADNFLSAAQLSDEEADALLAGKPYGPVLKNNEWTMSRALETRFVPDSLGIRHIVLPYTEEQLADSLLGVVRGGGDFAALAAQYSVYDQTAANGGEVGVLPYSAFTGEFADALADARKGDVVKVASGDAVQLLQVYRADRPRKHVRIASITYPVEASAATRREAHNAAGTFTVNAKGSVEAFNEAATTAAVTPRVATLSEGERTVRGLEDSRDIARWAYGAEEGDLSEIFSVGKDYVVAVLTGIDDGRYTPLSQVAPQIRSQILRNKKYDLIVASLAGTTLDEQAASLGSEVAEFKDVTYNSFYINGPGVEPRLIGAIASADRDAVTGPVKGMSGVYVFVVDEVAADDKQALEAERVRLQAMSESMIQQYAMQALQQMAEIRDLRGPYF